MSPNWASSNLRIAETEKYAHVTFFLNGGREEPFEGEDRILVPSPRSRPTTRSRKCRRFEVTDKLEAAIASGKYDLIVVNYANPDMVGHTGMLRAAEKAVHGDRRMSGPPARAVEKAGGVLLITADHGNVEMMRDPETGEPHTAHTTFDVPIIVVNAKRKRRETDARPSRRRRADTARSDGIGKAARDGRAFAGRSAAAETAA